MTNLTIFYVPYLYAMEHGKRVYNRIKAVLALKGVRNKALLEHLDVSEQTVSKWCFDFKYKLVD